MQKRSWQEALVRRWFVEFNPIYLVSALLVLGGMILTSRGLAHEGSVYGPLGVALVAEVYACALIAGAAVLVRIGQRRPAVMLALITVLYQSDLTLHTETCVYLGAVGVVAAVAWLGLFGAKLCALAWALRVRLTRRAFATASLGALVLAGAPHVLGGLDSRATGSALALVVFALGALAPRDPDDSVTSLVPLDAWGSTVARRTVRATWILWSVLFGGHVLFWSSDHAIDRAPFVFAIALVAMVRLRTEMRVWAGVGSVVLAAGVLAPSSLSVTALLAALALASRAFARVAAGASPATVPPPREPSPYRVGVETAAAAVATSSFAPVSADERARLLSGALALTYLSLWTLGWRGGPFPAHAFALDVVFAVGALLVVWRLRARLVVVPPLGACAHALAVSGLVPRPASLVEWGLLAVTLGFLLLGASVFISYRLREPVEPPIGEAGR